MRVFGTASRPSGRRCLFGSSDAGASASSSSASDSSKNLRKYNENSLSVLSRSPNRCVADRSGGATSLQLIADLIESRAGAAVVELGALVLLPDGRRGAIWRGLAYPLALPDHRIEMGSEAFAPSDCVLGPPRPAARPNFAVIEGADEAYVLVSGTVTACEEASSRLKVSGYEVIRTGRYLGDPVEDFEADWFVRIVRPAGSKEPLSIVLRNALVDQAIRGDGHKTLGEYRTQLIATELLSAKAREAALPVEIAQLRLEFAKAADAQVQLEELRAAVDLEREARQQADLAAAEAQELLNAARQNRPAPRVGKIRDEIEVVLAALIPEVRLMRDSVDVVSAEFSNRKALYRGLAELRTVAARLPPTWKKLKGLHQWWERHMSDGQDDAGRVYARYSNGDRVWDVLISHKSEQARDVAWLARQ